MKKKKIFIILIIIISIMLVIPIPLKLKDGGSTKFVSLFYSVTKIHRLNHQSSTGYEDGWKIEILGIQVYNEVDVYVEVENEEIEQQKKDEIKENEIDNSEPVQSEELQPAENTQVLPSTPSNNKNQSTVNTNSPTPNNKPSTSTTNSNNQQTSSTTTNTPTANDKQPTTNEPVTDNNKPSTNTTTTDNNQPNTDNSVEKEMEEAQKKWFINQYNLAKQQYINSLNSLISSKNNEIVTLKNEAKTCYTEYQQEIQRIKKQCANSGLSGSGSEQQKLKVAEENYKAKASVYTEKVKQLENEVSVLQSEISNPSVDSILSVLANNCNISSKEANDYYKKYL